MTTTNVLICDEQIKEAKAHPAWDAYYADARRKVLDATGEDCEAWHTSVAAAQCINKCGMTVEKKKKTAAPPSRGAVLIGSSTRGFKVWCY